MAEALTAQEQAIQEGKSTWVETSAGFNRLLDEIRRLPIRLLVDRSNKGIAANHSTHADRGKVRNSA
jgi:hypothetical protein